MRRFMKSWQTPLAMVCLCLCMVGGVAVALTRAEIATQEFHDQHGASDSLAQYLGTPVIVVVVSVRRLSMIERWERDLATRLPGVHFLNVADLPRDAPVDLERTAATLRKRVPPEVAVLLDPKGDWASTFGLDTALPNLLVFDAQGQLRNQFRGRWTASMALQVATAMPAETNPRNSK